jgi:hypothetical protein
MATIKLTGYKAGRQSTIGDTDTAVIDGSTILGDDINEDTITVQAEFTSHLIPDANDTYDLGSASNKWRNGYFDQVNAKLRDVKFAYYSYDGTDSRFIRFNTTGVGGNENAQANAVIVAPVDGQLLSVSIRSKNAAGQTNIVFHRQSNGFVLPNTPSNFTSIETQQVNIDATNSTFIATFSSSTFTAGQILGISVNPTSATEDVSITAVFMYDWNS